MLPSVALQGQRSHRDRATGVCVESQCLCLRAEGAAALLLGRTGAALVLLLPVLSFLGHWCFTCLCFVDLRWLISESNCCAVLAWTLPVSWSSPVVSVQGWQGGVSSCKGCSLPLKLSCQHSKQRGIFSKNPGSKGV